MKPQEFLESGEYQLKFQWLGKNQYGFIDLGKEIIIINIWLHLAETFIHEFVHDLYPQWKSEARVEKKAKRILKSMRAAEIKKLGNTLLCELYVSGGKRRKKRSKRKK